MPLPADRMAAIIAKYGITGTRKSLPSETIRLYIAVSSFSDANDGLSVTYMPPRGTGTTTVFTFQFVGRTDRFSMFFGGGLSADKPAVELLQSLIIEPLAAGSWTLFFSQGSMCIRNAYGETVPVKLGRRTWNYTLSQERSTPQVWYNPRPCIAYTPEPEAAEEAVIISTLALVPRSIVAAANLDGNFSPDASFTAEEVL